MQTFLLALIPLMIVAQVLSVMAIMALKKSHGDLLHEFHSRQVKLWAKLEDLENNLEKLEEDFIELEKKANRKPAENNWDGIRKAFTKKRVDGDI